MTVTNCSGLMMDKKETVTHIHCVLPAITQSISRYPGKDCY